MITPQQFIENFLKEKAAAFEQANVRLREIYQEYFGDAALIDRHLLADRQAIIETKQSDSSAKVITEIGNGKVKIRRRFCLTAISEGWKIFAIQNECIVCHGTGYQMDGSTCNHCNGEGWRDGGAQKAK